MGARSLFIVSFVCACGDGAGSSRTVEVDGAADGEAQGDEVREVDVALDTGEATEVDAALDSGGGPEVDTVADTGAASEDDTVADTGAGPELDAALDLGETPEVDAAEDTADVPASAALPIAFFYQDVAPTGNRVRVGKTSDGLVIDGFDRDAVSWTVFGQTQVFGDPVFSRLANGRWAMSATASPQDPRGPFALLYYEADCPLGVPAPSSPAVRAITASEAPGCRRSRETGMAKASQLFAAYGSTWMFISNMGSVLLLRVSGGDGGASALSSVCFLPEVVASRDDLAVGDATVVLASGVEGPIGDGATSGPLLLSDAAIARRADGTWVLFVKGVSRALGCAGGGLCELCARGIYRATSDDLVTWSALERVAYRASVPDSVTAPDGTVWLYWQEFGAACDAEDLQLAARAPILAARELTDGSLSPPVPVRFPEEPFETDSRLHYPTNANPVALPDAAAAAAFEACLSP